MVNIYPHPPAPLQRLDGVGTPAMLSLGGFPPPSCNASCLNSIPLSLPFPIKVYQPRPSFFPIPLTQLSFCAAGGKLRSRICVNALKMRRRGDNSILETDIIDNEDGDDDDDDDEVFIPLRNMKNWLENKPRGFGEGKVYDTSVEDELLEEMEQSQEAQLANINKLKNSPKPPNSKENQKQKASEVVPSGIRVRLVNLPKKKNIQRDLQLAFKEVPGIVNIIPVISGNKKTRDPVCKGLAFVDFNSEDDANRFVQVFSRKSITFGKMQKQIKCEIMNSNSLKSAGKPSQGGTYEAPQIVVPSLDSHAELDIDDHSVDPLEETSTSEYDSADDDHVSENWENREEKVESNLSEPDDGDSMEQRTEIAISLQTSTQQQKNRANKKKSVAKRKLGKVPKLNIPGSVNRLKIKEKAMLVDVFSKYATKAASGVKEQS